MQGKNSPERSAPIRVYAGVDVCKAWLDVYLHPVGQSFRVSNDRVGLKSLKRKLGGHAIALVVLEATGKYHREAHRNLHGSGLAVAVVNPLRSRLFAEAIGALAKTDAIDARVLALLAESLKPDATEPAPETLEELRDLVRARASFVARATALANQLGEARTAVLKAEIKRQLAVTRRSVLRLETEIERRVASDPALARRVEIVRSIAGAGAVAAMALVLGLAEIGSCSGKAAALLAGLAPIARDSGETKGSRHIKGGRADVRTGIYMAAVAAARCNPDLRAFYRRLRAAGKPFKVAITAVMRKLVVLANTLIREDRLWTAVRP